MASAPGRLVGWFPIVLLLAGVPLAWLSPPASAEARKFVVILADLPKDHPGTSLGGLLPRRADAYDVYFDRTKNSRTGGPHVDSFHEWWEQCSYGDVTVSGDAYGWVAVPWPSRPPGFDGDTGGHSSSVIEWIELQGGDSYQPGTGESFSSAITMLKYDYDGPGFGADPGEIGGAAQTDPQGFRVFTPGERFLDVRANGVYDAGIPELGIDKNGGGVDPALQANSWFQLIASVFQHQDPADPESPMVWVRFANNTEWLDSNGDGVQGLYGTEMWVDKNNDGLLGTKAEPEEGQDTVSLTAFITQLYDPESEVEWWDINENGIYDFPEPYEDYMRRWSAAGYDFLPITNQYITDNYPGTASVLQTWNATTNPNGRTGNRRYDSPDNWVNGNNDLNSTNKMQEVTGRINPAHADEASEQFDRTYRATPRPGWLNDFWMDYYGGPPPTWSSRIPYFRRFMPNEPVPWLVGQAEAAKPTFEPNRGGPYNNGQKYGAGDTETWGEGAGEVVQPDVYNGEIGMYDAPAEYHDIPSSIYHMDGDEGFGEMTGPENNSYWGKDTGPGDPDAPSFPDGRIPAAGPLAFNIHGDGGWDAGNQLTTEWHTWRTNGQNLTDDNIDFDGDGIADYITYRRDVNLDGMIDLGETPGLQSETGLANRTPQHNYGVDGNPGTPPNGGPQSLYPFNRLRMMEDCVEALDYTVDWDNFLNGPPPWGEMVSGVVLFPDGTASGMFGLPAAGYFGIRTRDRVDPSQTGRDYYTPITFFNGLGTALSTGQGEGAQQDSSTDFALGFSIHEYCHTWEGFPDLYDYDVWREDYTGRILNNPIGAWDIMAGGLVHPAGILKMSAGWIDSVDITRVAVPLANTTVTFYPWEFSRDRTLFQYDNPLYDGEMFHFWRNSHDIDSWDKNHPGRGIVLQHLDLHADPEGLPIQQRLESHFIYVMVQADGLEDMEAGRNGGDAGDSWPGSTTATVWNKGTDPSNRWYDEQPSGLEITNILETDDTSTDVTFFWSPRELPTYIWVQPPGDVSHQGLYTLKFVVYDQFGGTDLWFYAVPSNPDDPTPSYDNGISLNDTPYTKQPGEIDGTFGARVQDLPDGTYTFFVQLVPGVGADGRQENTHSRPRAGLDNIGNGRVVHEVGGQIVEGVDVDTSTSKLEVWTLTVTDDRSPGAETWQVVGQYSGTQTAQAVTGLLYLADPDTLGRSPISLTIQSGSIPFRNGDRFSFLTTGLTPHSSAVLIDNGEVVTPEPPIVTVTAPAGIAVEGGGSGAYRISRTGDASMGLTVYYAMSGTASSTDYTLDNPSPVTLPAGVSYKDVVLTAIDDAAYEGDETAVLTLSSNSAYEIGSPNSATITIQDNDSPPLPIVTVAAIDGTAAEGGETGIYRLSRTGDTSTGLAVYYRMSGSAGGGDYTLDYVSPVTIPPGAPYRDVVLTVIDDAAYEGDETAVLTLLSNSAYEIGSPNSATITIQDNDSGVPPNDLCANATPVGEGTFTADTRYADDDGEVEGECATWLDSHSVWWQYTPSATGLATIDTCGSDFDTNLAVLADCGGAQLACDDDCAQCANGNRSWLQYNVTGGTSYIIRVSSVSGQAGGNVVLHIGFTLLGDLNCDGGVDFDDINPFVTALVGREVYESRYPRCAWLNGDIDGDGDVSFDDISPFVKCLVHSGCP